MMGAIGVIGRVVVVVLGVIGVLVPPAQAQPMAAFSLSPASGPADLTVQFTDETSGGPSQWIWNFGDGSQATNTGGDVSHVYTAPGTYDVTLVVIGPGLQLDSHTEVGAVVVEPAILEPGFDVSLTSGVVGDTVQATSTTTGTTDALTTLWDFGDGTPLASGPSVQHQYTLPGTYTVTLTVSGGGTQESLTETDLISIDAVDLQAAFTPAAPVSGELPLSVTFGHAGQGVTPTAYLWDFGGAAPPSSQSTPTIVIGAPGSYDVSLTVSYFGQQQSLLVEGLLEVLAVPFAVGVETTAALAGPAPHLVSWQAVSTLGPEATGYAWDFGDGSQQEGPEASVAHVYTEPGQYAVSVRASYFGQDADAQAQEPVHVGPPDAWQVQEIGPVAGLVSGGVTNVAIDGDRLAVRDRDGDVVRVRVFERGAAGTWSLVATLLPDLGMKGSGLGALALDGDILLAGDVQQQRPGRVSVFERQPGGAWVATATLTTTDEKVFHFGRAVALQRGRALIGATSLQVQVTKPGHAYVFDRQPDGSWQQVAHFNAPEDVKAFGRDVALTGDRAIVAANGQVATFCQVDDGSWIQAPLLLPEPGISSAAFARGLAAHGERLAVVGFESPDFLVRVGSYRWSGGAWQLQEILDLDHEPDDAYVHDLEMTATRLVLGDTGAVSGRGALYMYDLQDDGHWGGGRRAIAADGAAGDGLGSDVAVDGDDLLAVASGHDHNPGLASGAAYILQRVVQADLGVGGPEGVSLALAGGDLTAPGAQATLSLTAAPPAATVVLVAGLDSFEPPLFAQGGLLVPMPELLLSGLTTSAAGAAFLPVTNVGTTPTTLFLQAVVAGPDGAQFSNALAVTLGL